MLCRLMFSVQYIFPFVVRSQQTVNSFHTYHLTMKKLVKTLKFPRLALSLKAAYRALHDKGLIYRLDEVVILGSAVGTLDRPGIFAVEVKKIGSRIDDRTTTILTGSSECATRNCSKYVVRIHRAEDQSRSVPTFSAGNTSQITSGAFQAPHADGIKVEQLVVGQDLQVALVPLRREEECAINKWIAIVHSHVQAAAHTLDKGNLMSAQIGQHKTPSFIVTMRTFILHLDVVRILLVSGQNAERCEICPAFKDVARSCLFCISEKFEFAFLHQTSRGKRRGLR